MPESSLLPCCLRALFTVFAPCLAPQRALDANLLSFTVWNYCAENSNERGDLWNDEDLSVFSPDQRHRPEDLHSGGRALPALVRPYALRTAGEPLNMTFQALAPDRSWMFQFRHDPVLIPEHSPTVIFVPQYQYLREVDLQVDVSDGSFKVQWDQQTLTYVHTTKMPTHTITLRLRRGAASTVGLTAPAKKPGS